MASVVNSFYSQLGLNTDYLAAFGGIIASYYIIKLICSLWHGFKTYFLAKSLGLSADLRKMGEWAVVTGATDGIGLQYAHQLAKRGINIVLISRNPEKLSNCAKEIESKYNVKTKVVAIEFTQGLDIYHKIKQELAGLEVGVLVNNVGLSYDYPQFFLEVPEERVENIINVNCHSVTKMTRIVLPGMVERRRGVILNLTSASTVNLTPLLTVYAATKKFVDFYTQCMHAEYRSKGIIFQSVKPFFVSTKMSHLRPNAFVPMPPSYVSEAIGTVGMESSTYGCMNHALQGYFAEKVPTWLYVKVGMSNMLVARKKNLKRLANKTKEQ